MLGIIFKMAYSIFVFSKHCSVTQVRKMSSHKFELLDEEVEAVMDQVTDKLQVSTWKSHLIPLLMEVHSLACTGNVHFSIQTFPVTKYIICC